MEAVLFPYVLPSNEANYKGSSKVEMASISVTLEVFGLSLHHHPILYCAQILIQWNGQCRSKPHVLGTAWWNPGSSIQMHKGEGGSEGKLRLGVCNAPCWGTEEHKETSLDWMHVACTATSTASGMSVSTVLHQTSQMWRMGEVCNLHLFPLNLCLPRKEKKIK